MTVYVVQAASTGRYKVGRTDNVRSRVNSMQTGCPYRLDVVNEIECEHDPSAEKDLHRILRRWHVRGEWFEPPKDVVYWLKRCTGRDISRVQVAKFLLSKDLGAVFPQSKVDEIRRSMLEVLDGYGLQDRWTKERDTEQSDDRSSPRHISLCRG